MVTVTATPYGSGLYGAGRYGGQLMRTGAAGRGGAVAFRAHYYRTDRMGAVLDDLSAVMRDGMVTWNADQDTHHGELRCTATPGGAVRVDPVNPDYLKVTVDLAYADGATVTEEPLGWYRVIEVNPTLDGHGRSDDILAYDPVYELSTSRITIPYTIPAGSDPIAYLVANLQWIGFTADQWAGPATGRPTPAALPYSPGTDRQTIMNDLLSGMGCYYIYTTRDGKFTSSPSVTLGQNTPVATYLGSPDPRAGSTILPGAVGTPDYSRICNVVTVRKITPGSPPIYWTAKNEDSSSPLALVHNGVGVLALPPVDNPQLTTKEEAKAQAELLLSEGSSYNDRWEFATHPDPFFGLHDVVTVSITAPDGSDALSGAFWRRTIEFPLSLAGWGRGQRMSLSRLTPIEITGEGAP